MADVGHNGDVGRSGDAYTSLVSQPLRRQLLFVAMFVVVYAVLSGVWDWVANDKSFGHGVVSNIVPGVIIGVIAFLVLPGVAARWRKSRS